MKTKRFKKILSTLSALCLMISMFGGEVFAETPVESGDDSVVEVQNDTGFDENELNNEIPDGIDQEWDEQMAIGQENDETIQNETVTSDWNEAPITGEKESQGITVIVYAPVGSFPAGTSLQINELNQQDTAQKVQEIVSGAQGVAFNIDFYNANGEKVQPTNGKSVSVSFVADAGSMMSSEEEDTSLKVYHVQEDGSPELMKVTEAPTSDSSMNINFEANSFSTYILLKDEVNTVASNNQTRSAKELTNVISGIKLWTVNDGGYVPVSGGTYRLVQGNPYRFEVDFDLSAYNGNLENGDYFTFTVPEPITVKDGTITFTHEETGIAIGLGQVVSNGENKGGVVRVTLQNLDEYLRVTGGSEVLDIKGTFYVDFSVSEIVTDKTVTYSTSETIDAISHTITVVERSQSDYSEQIGKSNFNKFGGVLTNKPYTSEILGKSGDYIHTWTVRVNVRQESYDTITIHDLISNEHAPMQYIPESLTISYGFYNSSYSFDYEGYLVEGTDYTITYNSSYTAFDIVIHNASARTALNGKPASYQLSYSTTSPADGSYVANTVQVSGDETPLTIATDNTKTSTTLQRLAKITQGGSITIDVAYRIVLYKVDASTGNMLEGAVFKVITPTGEEIELPPTDENGRTYSRAFTSQEAAAGDFTIVEVSAPTGFKLLEQPITVKVGAEGAIKTISNEPNKTSVTVTKAWNDADNRDGIRPISVTVKLFAGDTDTGKTVELNAANNWTATFTDLVEYQNGQLVDYRVEEVGVEGYITGVSGDAQTGYTIINSHEPELIDINGSKTWDDNNDQDGVRPAQITIRLLANGEEVNSITTTEADDWSWSFTDLPKYENEGSEISYSINEDAITDYTTEYDGYNVINTHAPGKTSVTVTKAWNDANNQDGIRPLTVTVKLFAGDTDTGKTVELNATNNWTANFTDLDAYQNGQKIEYRVVEQDVEGYVSMITGDAQTGYTITNTYEPELIDINGSKTWKDNNDQDGVRPDQITIRLLANGEEVNSITTTEADDWSWSFTNLPKYANEGSEISYSIKEDAITDYTTEYDGYDVINTHAPGKTSVTVTKAWNDANNQDGIRPLSVTVKLFAGDTDTGKTVELNAANNWSASFTDLDEYQNGQKIEYRVVEQDVEGYVSSVSGDAQTGYTIINTHEPELIDINGAKTWEDNNDQDGVRPDQITIRLLANGEEVNSITTTEADDWSWSFTDLPKYENEGSEISYSIKEDAVTDYTTEYDGYDVINTHAPGKTSVSVSKVWNDYQNKDNTRTKKVTIHLFANGVDTGKTLILSDENNWTGAFSDLDQYVDGKLIEYTISEETVNGYVTNIKGDATKGFTVTNTKKTTPSTGIINHMFKYTLLMAAAGVAIFSLVATKKKR
ncbi:MAG: Cna B-type domain-containing protein [Erysipelotrichaceae bacterium]|nr:Cna B-type domain-containing protein [Erysipelotrichaceae bacterium]